MLTRSSIPIMLIAMAALLLPAALRAQSRPESGPTTVTVRVVSRAAKVVGSHVGGARVTIREIATGRTLALGTAYGPTGSTDEIMLKAHKIGEPVYSTKESAHFVVSLALTTPTLVEVMAEAPLGAAHALQRGSKTVLLVPGKNITGEGIVIELNGLIVNLTEPSPLSSLKIEDTVSVQATVVML